jgi:hypothetical protein
VQLAAAAKQLRQEAEHDRQLIVAASRKVADVVHRHELLCRLRLGEHDAHSSADGPVQVTHVAWHWGHDGGTVFVDR